MMCQPFCSWPSQSYYIGHFPQVKSTAKDVTESFSDLKVMDMVAGQEPLRAHSKSIPGTVPVFYRPRRIKIHNILRFSSRPLSENEFPNKVYYNKFGYLMLLYHAQRRVSTSQIAARAHCLY